MNVMDFISMVRLHHMAKGRVSLDVVKVVSPLT